MAHLIALFLTVLLGAGALSSGTDLMDLMVRLAQVATERLTLNQIGKAIVIFNTQHGRKLTYGELPKFLRANITTGSARDPAVDRWGTYYYLENDKYFTYEYPKTSDFFAVCSAGPDKKWWNADDETWMNFTLPDEVREKLSARYSVEKESGSAMTKLDALRKQTADQFKSMAALLGADVSKETTGVK